jgi:hypothetical protein
MESTTTAYPEPPAWKIWQNPVFCRYCRSRLRPTGLAVSLLLMLLITGFFFAIFRENALSRVRLQTADAERFTIMPVIVLQAIVLFILGTAQVSGGMISEADEGTLDYQRLMPVRPLTKVLGYLFGLPVREYLMCLVVMPLAMWGFWRGEVPFHVALSIYGTLFGSALLYHVTALLTGTVVKNRRWAFLVSIGLVFALYTVVPQLSHFGLVCFKYLGITPVLEEHWQYFAPRSAGKVIQATQNLLSEARFFNLKFPEAVFVLFCQSGLVLAFLHMLYRRWRKTESLLLGKWGAVLLNAWIHVLLLGNALPLIDSGSLFPSREVNRYFRSLGSWTPGLAEGALMCCGYAVLSLCLVYVLTNLCTPSEEMQRRAWRKARKYQESKLSFLADAATSFWSALAMCFTAVAGWYLFSRGIIESRWFPGHFVTTRTLFVLGGTFLALGLSFQAFLEGFGGKKLLTMGVVVGLVPMMIGAVMQATGTMQQPAIWIAGASPFTTLLLAIGSEISLVELPLNISRTVPMAFAFWGTLHGLAMLYLLYKLKVKRSALAVEAS